MKYDCGEREGKKMRIMDVLEDSPVIAAVKNDGGLEQCLKSECQVVFILYGSICNVSDIVRRIKE